MSVLQIEILLIRYVRPAIPKNEYAHVTAIAEPTHIWCNVA